MPSYLLADKDTYFTIFLKASTWNEGFDKCCWVLLLAVYSVWVGGITFIGFVKACRILMVQIENTIMIQTKEDFYGAGGKDKMLNKMTIKLQT